MSIKGHPVPDTAQHRTLPAVDGSNSSASPSKIWHGRTSYGTFTRRRRQPSLSIISRVTPAWQPSLLRFVHTRLDAKEKIVDPVEEHRPRGAHGAPTKPTTSERGASAAHDRRPIAPLNNSSQALAKSLTHGSWISRSFFARQEDSELDSIFVNPVLHIDNGAAEGPVSKGMLPRLYHRWFEEFSRVASHRLGLETLEPTAKQGHHFSFAKLIEEKKESSQTSTNSTQSEALATWHSLDDGQRRDFWMPALLYALHEDSRIASNLLLTIMDHDSELLPSYVAGDAVALISHTLLPKHASRVLNEQDTADCADTELCFKVAVRFLESYKGIHQLGSLSRKTVGLITKALDGTQIEKWIEKLMESSHLLTPGDKLYLASHATKQGKPAAALDLLRTMSPNDMGTSYAAAACTMMLQMEIPSENLNALRSNMLMVMLELGVRPDARMRDLIIAHAMETGDREAAWSIHEQALQNGIKPSPWTYAHLLDGVKHADDLSTLFSIYREARHSGLTQSSPQLGNALIRALFLALEGSRRSFDTMMVMYAELFDLKPLQDLGLAKQIAPQKTVRRMRPPLLTLQAMIIAWIKSCTSLNELTTVYNGWNETRWTGSTRIAILKRMPHVARSFIVQFDRLGARHMCDRVMEDFMRGQPRVDFTVDPKDVVIVQAPAEHDVKIWTSLIQSHARRGQLSEAERIVREMKSHGIEPDAVTFEVLLLAYARNQDIPKAAETLGQKHKAGFDLDEWTLKAIGEIRDREALRKSLQEVSFAHS